MQYTLMFYLGPEEFEERSHPEKQKKFYAAFMPYMKAMQEAGIYVTGAGLQPPSAATTVRLRNGERMVQDGPFADTKEQLGGFAVIEAPDLGQRFGLGGPLSCRRRRARRGAPELAGSQSRRTVIWWNTA